MLSSFMREVGAASVFNLFKDKLTDRNFIILTLRFGLDGRPPLILEEIGVELSISKERVRQVLLKIFEDCLKDDNSPLRDIYEASMDVVP